MKKVKLKKLLNQSKNSNISEYRKNNLHLSPGWFDLHVNFGEPGYEQQETLITGSNAAIKGGYTGVLIMPNNQPSIDNKTMINFIQNTIKDNIIDLIPAGNITKNGEGNDIVEMHDMQQAGCAKLLLMTNSLLIEMM